MAGKVLIKAVVLGCVTFLAVVLTGQTAPARKPNRTPKTEIISVHVDLGAYELVIDGSNLDSCTTGA